MNHEDQIRAHLNQLMSLCDEDQNWAIKKLAKITLGTMNVPQAMQYPIAVACEKALEEVYTQWPQENWDNQAHT
ncbi:hypothetical protein [Spirosoma endbachense]|uniref:Uncharacterized protein n=1 Tax=Spirosoma endbachense TaxID=2666025 RepID=A0A6P1VT84_9BACT|nr:hypothetical protein [Spirosoma endbachense]QHV95628.1 hypothetical protein GJR95_11705 [Spirosoma endbachense]